jgi:hypothetical protein
VIIFICSTCGDSSTVAPELAGKVLRCPFCEKAERVHNPNRATARTQPPTKYLLLGVLVSALFVVVALLIQPQPEAAPQRDVAAERARARARRVRAEARKRISRPVERTKLGQEKARRAASQALTKLRKRVAEVRELDRQSRERIVAADKLRMGLFALAGVESRGLKLPTRETGIDETKKKLLRMLVAAQEDVEQVLSGPEFPADIQWVALDEAGREVAAAALLVYAAYPDPLAPYEEAVAKAKETRESIPQTGIPDSQR